MDFVERERLIISLDLVQIVQLDEAGTVLCEPRWPEDFKRIVRNFGPKPPVWHFISSEFGEKANDWIENVDQDAIVGLKSIDYVPDDDKPAPFSRITQSFIKAEDNDNAMDPLLQELLKHNEHSRHMILVRTKSRLEAVQSHLMAIPLRKGIIHGNMHQSVRDKAIAEFEDGSIDILLATFGTAGMGINLNQPDYLC